VRSLRVYRLGRVEYEDGLALQRLFGRARMQNLVPDCLLLLEHPAVLTLGRAAKRTNIVALPEELERLGVQVHETDRGGDVTYHGPGQIVGYPILLLAPDRQDVRKYVRGVEEAIIRAVAQLGIHAARLPKWPGVWLGQEGAPDARKIAAIGVHLSRWLTSHGFALNVNTQLDHFDLIVPCGIREAGVTSIARELGSVQELGAVEDAVARAFAEVFESELELPPAPALRTVAVAVTRADRRVLLLKRTEARGGFWQLVTGKVEAHEAPPDAAAREVREEIGHALTVRPLHYTHSFALGEELPPVIAEETAFAAECPADAAITLSEEHSELRWATLSEADALLPFPGLRESARRALAFR
jgi:lipoyl(octanoyl) transferase